MIAKVTHVSIFVPDQDEALKFYRDTLGFKVHTDLTMENFRWLTLNAQEQPDFEIALLPAEDAEEKALIGKQAAKKPLLCFSTKNCRETYQKLKAKGVKFLGEPTDKPWGVEVLFSDPYGNIFDLVEPS
jgi:predicted enzyme related to lactoylglutathione lyase